MGIRLERDGETEGSKIGSNRIKETKPHAEKKDRNGRQSEKESDLNRISNEKSKEMGMMIKRVCEENEEKKI